MKCCQLIFLFHFFIFYSFPPTILIFLLMIRTGSTTLKQLQLALSCFLFFLLSEHHAVCTVYHLFSLWVFYLENDVFVKGS